jgi:hypothetical protein
MSPPPPVPSPVFRVGCTVVGLLTCVCARACACAQRHLGKGFHCGSSVTAVELLQGLSASLASVRAAGKAAKPGRRKRGASADKVCTHPLTSDLQPLTRQPAHPPTSPPAHLSRHRVGCAEPEAEAATAREIKNAFASCLCRASHRWRRGPQTGAGGPGPGAAAEPRTLLPRTSPRPECWPAPWCELPRHPATPYCPRLVPSCLRCHSLLSATARGTPPLPTAHALCPAVYAAGSPNAPPPPHCWSCCPAG